MRIASWNINGIRARRDSLLGWIDRKKPDILVLEELKAQEKDIPEEIVAMQGYKKYWNGSAFRKGYSGVGLLLKEGLCGECRLEIPEFDCENRTVVLHGSNLSVIGTYVPRGDGDAHYAVKLGYLSDLGTYILELLREGRQVIHTGDINVAHTDLDVHHSQNKPGIVGLRPEERAAIDRHLEIGLHDIMRERFPDKKDMFTWWPYWKGARERNLGWRIDCFYLSKGLIGDVVDVRIDSAEKSSDHAPVILDIRSCAL
ncbi:MAG: exodeoxyribonuclease III [Chlorobium phaeobacteroides]|uniref:Exodeoxyribonuclease III Xth n=1 Tax=Chlorobium phaeobacteroides (strain BS1) TaxID=331678 RepID=B3EKF8_CHLPB|nr:exodeoxyribonuclease III [Chlorobium phaeobacteroides]MBL6956548.1 exodeoxyribonuclease III [Chlorobium phaeobacteroides]